MVSDPVSLDPDGLTGYQGHRAATTDSKGSFMDNPLAWRPPAINTGSWLTGYSLNALLDRVGTDRIVLPICSLGTPFDDLASLAPLVLPPLYHEALDGGLRTELLDRIGECFPFYSGTRRAGEATFDVVELPPTQHPPCGPLGQVVTFSVDTAVEEHGPHLPLATDTLQSYAVLERLAAERDGVVIAPPVDYGQLTWGLPFGMSIDITAALLTRYVTGFANAIVEWLQPAAAYVVDVHGSIVHRTAIQDGLAASNIDRWSFRWLHDPLVALSGDRGDQHAGGVETALIEWINPALIDADWWPARRDELLAAQMSLSDAVSLSSDLTAFIERVEHVGLNGIVGGLENYDAVEGTNLAERVLEVARGDLEELFWTR